MSATAYGVPNRSRGRRLLRVSLILAPLAWAVIVCGQLPLPIPGAERTFRSKVRRDFKFELPPNVTVERGTHVPAFLDPHQYYVLRAASGIEANRLIIALRKATWGSTSPREERDVASVRDMFSRRPAWWKPEELPLGRVFKTYANRQVYYWMYSIESDRIYVFWFDT